jgi:hypothetical protein
MNKTDSGTDIDQGRPEKAEFNKPTAMANFIPISARTDDREPLREKNESSDLERDEASKISSLK